MHTIIGFVLGFAFLAAVRIGASFGPANIQQAFETAGLALLALSIAYVAASAARAKWDMIASACAGYSILPALVLVRLSLALL